MSKEDTSEDDIKKKIYISYKHKGRKPKDQKTEAISIVYRAPPYHPNHHLNDTFNRAILEDLIGIDEEFERFDVGSFIIFNSFKISN